MLNFINKILNYFGYVIRTTSDIEGYLHEIDSLSNSVQELNSNNFKLFKEKDRLINLVAEKDKDILALEHKVENFQGLIELDKNTIEVLNKQTIQLGNDNADLELRIYNLDKVCKERYKEVNTLRSREKALKESRDNYKRKYRELCGKIALKKYPLK